MQPSRNDSRKSNCDIFSTESAVPWKDSGTKTFQLSALTLVL